MIAAAGRGVECRDRAACLPLRVYGRVVIILMVEAVARRDYASFPGAPDRRDRMGGRGMGTLRSLGTGLALVSAIVVLGAGGQGAAAADDGPPPVTVAVATAARTTLTQHLYTEGTAHALRREILQFDRAGRVVQIGTDPAGERLHEGSVVKGPDAATGEPGTLIALLADGKLADDVDARTARYQAALDRAKAAEVALADAGATERAAETALARTRTLVQQGVVPAKRLEEAEIAAVNARNAVGRARSELGAARADSAAVAAERQGAISSLREGALRAPFDGVIAFLNVREGSRAAPLPPGLAEADLLRQAPAVVISPDDFEIVAQVPWSQAISLKPGQEAEVTWGGLGLFEMYDDRKAAGQPADDLPVVSATIWAVAPAVMPDTRSVRVRLRTAQPSPQLRDGLFVSTRVVAGRLHDVLAVPRQAIRHGGGDPYVYVVTGGEGEGDGAVVERRTVVTGAPTRNLIQVVEGLEEGERVVVRGQAQLMDGARVRVLGGESRS